MSLPGEDALKGYFAFFGAKPNNPNQLIQWSKKEDGVTTVNYGMARKLLVIVFICFLCPFFVTKTHKNKKNRKTQKQYAGVEAVIVHQQTQTQTQHKQPRQQQLPQKLKVQNNHHRQHKLNLKHQCKHYHRNKKHKQIPRLL